MECGGGGHNDAGDMGFIHLALEDAATIQRQPQLAKLSHVKKCNKNL